MDSDEGSMDSDTEVRGHADYFRHRKAVRVCGVGIALERLVALECGTRRVVKGQ